MQRGSSFLNLLLTCLRHQEFKTMHMKETKIAPGYLFSKGYTNYIFSLLFLLYMFDYIDRMVISSLFPFLKADWNLTDTECGSLV